jgi:hypothetical protein
MLLASPHAARRTAVNASTRRLRPAYAGIAVALALVAGVALTQWTLAAQFTHVLDWQQTAFALYLVAVGTLGSLLILPALIADHAGRAS